MEIVEDPPVLGYVESAVNLRWRRQLDCGLARSNHSPGLLALTAPDGAGSEILYMENSTTFKGYLSMQLDENVVPEQEFALRGPEPSAASSGRFFLPSSHRLSRSN